MAASRTYQSRTILGFHIECTRPISQWCSCSCGCSRPRPSCLWCRIIHFPVVSDYPTDITRAIPGKCWRIVDTPPTHPIIHVRGRSGRCGIYIYLVMGSGTPESLAIPCLHMKIPGSISYTSIILRSLWSLWTFIRNKEWILVKPITIGRSWRASPVKGRVVVAVP